MKSVDSRLYRLVFLFCCFSLGAPRHAAAGAVGLSPNRDIDWVDPLIGSGGLGFGVGSAFVGPTMPFGFIRPGPDTTKGGQHPGFYHCSGYYHGDTQIRGFSHTHLHGTGVEDYGNLLLMPAVGEAAPFIDPKNRWSRFTHNGETARVGYYAVNLTTPGVRAELTAGLRVALHRYHFPATPNAQVVVDASHFIGGGKAVDTTVKVDESRRTVTGWFRHDGPMSGRAGGYTVYFVVQSQGRFDSHLAWADGKPLPGASQARGLSAGVVLGFDASDQKPVLLRVAISYLSVEQAWKNLHAELPGENFDFEKLRRKTENRWEQLLSRVQITTPDAALRKRFTTALYQSLLMPTHFTEAGGWYRGFDRQPHRARGFTYYTDFSLWDTYRTQHPLLALVYPDYQSDMAQSLVVMAQQGGVLPRWPIALGESGVMIGDSAAITLTDTWLKGVRGFDVAGAYAAMRRNAVGALPRWAIAGGRGGALADYQRLGYVPADRHGGSVSQTLEFAQADDAVARLAAGLGKKEDARLFGLRGKNYRHVFDPATGFMRAKNADGGWAEPFRDREWSKPYVEGDAWQWTWLAPHDPEGLMALFGGKKPFLAKLEAFFSQSHKLPDTMAPDIYYWHGNEPDIHAPFLFALAGQPHRMAEEVRWILSKKYKNSPAGLDGNDDAGTLSAWYVFAAMGFYPLAGTDRYVASAPLFEQTVLRLPGGKTLTVKAPGASAQNLYPQGLRLGGKNLNRWWFTHAELMKAGGLNLPMSDQPLVWGTKQ